MAGAFDDFVPPQQQQSQGGGAFSGFTPPAAAAPPTDPEQLMLQHMASWLPGAAWLHNLTKVGEAGFTGGLSNRMDQALSGNTIEQEAAKTQAAREAVGPVASTIAEAAGNMAGVGKALGGAGLLTSGLTQGALQGIGSSDDPTKWATDATMSGALGVGANIAGKTLVNPIARAIANTDAGQAVAQKLGYGALKTPKEITQALANQEKQDWQATRIPVDNADVRQAATQAQQDIDNQAIANPRVKIGGQGAYQKLTDLADEALGNQPMTVERLNDYVKDLHVNNTGDLSPQAGLLGQNRINQLLAGPAQDALDTAKSTSQQLRDAQALQSMGEKLANFGTSPNKPAAAIASRWYDPGDPQFEAWKNIANSGQGYANTQTIAHYLGHPTVAATLAGVGLGTGHPAAVLGGMGIVGAKMAIGSALQRLQQRAQSGTIADAYPALTGYATRYSPNLTSNPAVRALLFGPAADYFRQ